jgi:hypothetical protein
VIRGTPYAVTILCGYNKTTIQEIQNPLTLFVNQPANFFNRKLLTRCIATSTLNVYFATIYTMYSKWLEIPRWGLPDFPTGGTTSQKAQMEIHIV